MTRQDESEYQLEIDEERDFDAKDEDEMMNTQGPVYGVRLIDTLKLNGGMKQAMPGVDDLQKAMPKHMRLCAGYEVLLSKYHILMHAMKAIAGAEDAEPGKDAEGLCEAMVERARKTIEACEVQP